VGVFYDGKKAEGEALPLSHRFKEMNEGKRESKGGGSRRSSGAKGGESSKRPPWTVPSFAEKRCPRPRKRRPGEERNGKWKRRHPSKAIVARGGKKRGLEDSKKDTSDESCPLHMYVNTVKTEKKFDIGKGNIPKVCC